MIAAESWKKKIETFCRKEMNMKKRRSPVQKKDQLILLNFHTRNALEQLSLSLSLSLSDDEMNAFQRRKHFRKSKEEVL